MISFFLIFFCAGLTAVAQQSSRLNISGGAIFDKPLDTSSEYKDDGNSTSYYEWHIDHYVSAGYFVKAGYDKKLFNRGSWSLYLPMSLSYLRQVTTYKESGYASGCFVYVTANDIVRHTNQLVNYSIGPALHFSKNRMDLGLGASYNQCFSLVTQMDRQPLESNDNFYTRKNKQKMVNHYFSAHISVMTRVSERVSVGPTFEVFFTSLGKIINEVKGVQQPDYFSVPVSNLMGDNIWINPGAKLCFDLH